MVLQLRVKKPELAYFLDIEEFAQAADFIRREFAHGWLRSKISAGSGGMLVAASSRPAR
jgi:hypothetical protein